MKRTLTLLLAALLLCSLLVACKPDTPPVDPDDDGGDASGQPGDATPTEPDASDEPAEPTDAAGVLATFEKKSYDAEFLVMASNTYENRFTIQQFAGDDDVNGDIVHDALFNRDRMIEEHLGVDIVYDETLDSKIYEKTGNAIRSGDDIYSLLLGSLYPTCTTFLTGELLYDLASIETIDLSASYWNQNSVETFTLNDICYMATGAITNRSVYAPYATLFNDRLLEAAGMLNPFDLMEMDEWTFENFQYMIMGTSHELNGNDTLGLEDFYGLAPANDAQNAWFFAIGGQLGKVDEDGQILTVYEQEDNYDRLAMISELYKSDDVIPIESGYSASDAFKEGRAIFHSMALCDITLLSEMEDKYSIVPMPKLDAEQERYYCNTNKYINTMAMVPVSVRNTEEVGNVVELMAALSQVTSLDKQYETILLNRQALNAESKAALQLTVESASYDWIYILDPAGAAATVSNGLIKGSELASSFASLRSPVAAALEEIAALYE